MHKTFEDCIKNDVCKYMEEVERKINNISTDEKQIDDFKAIIEKLGIKTVDENGNYRLLIDVMQELSDKWEKLDSKWKHNFNTI